MSQTSLKIVHYLNQFFGQEGGEDKAHIGFMVKEGPIGPGIALQNILGDRGRVIATLICGDNYFAENVEKVAEEGLELIKPFAPDLFFAGPAFGSGRYGISCGGICKIVQEKFQIPAISGMSEENPGVDLFRKDIHICKTGKAAGKMVDSLNLMVRLGLKLALKEGTPKPSIDNYFSRGVIENEYTDKTAIARGVDMLLAKIQGRPFQSEVALPEFQPIVPPAPIKKDLSDCELALISDGGLTQKGNPDGFAGRGNTVLAAYDMDRFFPEDYTSDQYEIVHTGYSPDYVLENPNRLVPVDIMRELEREKVIGKLHQTFYSTSGNGGLRKRCTEMGEEIVGRLRSEAVDGAILTST